VSTLAGSVEGFWNGMGSAAAFYGPNGIAIDTMLNLFVTDSNNNVIRKIAPNGKHLA
jgi:hypothetical protein